MLAAVTDGITTVIGWVGSVITSIVGEAGQLKDLKELFVIGISISAVFLGVKVVKSITWGA